MKKLGFVQIVSSKPINSFGTTQFRCLQTAEYLRTYGYQVNVGHIYEANPIKRGVIFVHRAILDKYTDAFLSLARVRGNVIIYDSDDLIYRLKSDIYTNAGLKEFNKSALLRGYAAMKCDVFAVATDYLAHKAKEFHEDVRVIRNALSKAYSNQARKIYEEKQRLKPNMVTVGYLSGSWAHDRDFLLVEKVLVSLLQERKDVRVLLVGKLSFSEDFYSFGNRFNYVKFLPYNDFVALYRDVDINLIPLEMEDEFCQGKSELKYIEAGACGVVSVASPTETYKSIITNGVNGFLVESNEASEWYKVLSKLIDSLDIRMEVGECAYRHVIEKYSADVRAKELNEMIQDIRLHYLRRYKNKYSSFVTLMGCINLERLRFLRKLKQVVHSQILKYKLRFS